MFQIYYRYLQLKYKINKVLPTIITDFGFSLLPYPWKKTNNFIQVLNINDNHWICAARHNSSIVRIYDSSHKTLKKNSSNVVSRYARTNDKSLTLHIMNVKEQNEPLRLWSIRSGITIGPVEGAIGL